MFMPEVTSLMSGSGVVPAVSVIIVSATIIPSIAVVVFIVGVLPVALLLSCPPCPCPDRCHRHLASHCHCCGHVLLLPPCPPSPSLIAVARSTCPRVAIVSAVAVSLAAADALSSRQRSLVVIVQK